MIDEVAEEVADAMIMEIRMEEDTVDGAEEGLGSVTTTDAVEEVEAIEVEGEVGDGVEAEGAEGDVYLRDSVRQVVGVLRRRTPFPSRRGRERSPPGTSSLLDSTTTPSSKLK